MGGSEPEPEPEPGQEVAELHELLDRQLKLAAARLQADVRAAAAATRTGAAEAQARRARAAAAAAREAERDRIQAAQDRARTDTEHRAAAAAELRLLVGLPPGAGEQELVERQAEVAEVFAALPGEALAAVCSHLSPKVLGRLACASRRFTEPIWWANLSAVEEGARLAVLRHPRLLAVGGPAALEGSTGVSWHRLLWSVGAPVFTTASSSCEGAMVLSGGGAVARSLAAADETAVCDTPLLLTGIHRAEFTFEKLGRYNMNFVGIVGSGYKQSDNEMLEFAPHDTWMYLLRGGSSYGSINLHCFWG